MDEVKKASPYAKSFSCPNCAGSVNIRALGSSINVVCSYCSSIIDVNDENFKVVETFTNKIKKKQVIDLGQRGELFGKLWETIGYMERTDSTGFYTWSEYLLFNPLQGFRWLTEYAGHWTFVTTIKDKPNYNPKLSYNTIRYKDKIFQVFNKGTATVSFVMGEFYWQVRIGETFNLAEYIAPPEIYSVESNDEELIGSIGVYTLAESIKNGFKIDKPMPPQIGVAPNQPNPLSPDIVSKIRKYWLGFLGIFLFIQIGFCIGNSSKTIYRGKLEFNASDAQKTKVTPQFEIKESSTTLDVRFHSIVNNSWLEINADLVNDENGETVEFAQGIEYYSGVDSDGAWTEGSHKASEKLATISKGKYHLNLEVSGPTLTSKKGSGTPGCPTCLTIDIPGITNSNSVLLDVEVKTGATLWSNFYLAIFLISFYPLFMLWKKRKFEVNRWSESDFSPYYSSDGED